MTKSKLLKMYLMPGVEFSFVRTLCKVSNFVKYENGCGVYLLTNFWGGSYVVWVKDDTVVEVVKE